MPGLSLTAPQAQGRMPSKLLWMAALTSCFQSLCSPVILTSRISPECVHFFPSLLSPPQSKPGQRH